MIRHDSEVLAQVTCGAEKYLRRCNGLPPEGILTDAAGLRVVLATSAAVTIGAGGVITWRHEGRMFTAHPVLDETESAACR